MIASPKDAGGCPNGCRQAVLRCYNSMLGSGVPETHAFQAALDVYRWHHPEVGGERALATVSGWLIGGGTVTCH